MKSSNIGGQAVMEGVMMQANEKYAIAVRRANNEIDVSIHDCSRPDWLKKIRKVPFLRGVFNFVDSLVIGMKTLTYSANILLQDEEAKEAEGREAQAKETDSTETKDTTIRGAEEKNAKDKEGGHGILLAGTVIVSLLFSIALFIILPWLASEGLRRFFHAGETLIVLIEGLIRIAIFLLYLFLVSRMEDIQRVFRYHGAEHKCINCIESGKLLTVENVRESSRLHRRCGTSFLFIVMLVSLILFMLIRISNPFARLGFRLLMLPVIAGISYEFIRLAGSSDNRCVMALSKPGMLLQKITTAEPDDQMIEVGIASVEGVFDWKNYLRENGVAVPEEKEQE